MSGALPYTKSNRKRSIIMPKLSPKRTVRKPAKRQRLEARIVDEPRCLFRLERYITDEQYRLFKHAAVLQRCPISEFVIAAAREKAAQTIESIEITRSNNLKMTRAILNPRQPNSRLRAAARRYMANHRAARETP